MYATYFNTTTSSTTPAVPFDTSLAAGATDLRILKKLFIGNPVSGATLTIFNENNALSNNTTQIAALITLPTFSTTNINVVPLVIDFTTNSNANEGVQGADGLPLIGGGSMAISSTMQVTALWDYGNT